MPARGILCEIIGKGDEFGAAMEDLWGFTKELTGLTELEACLNKKTLDHCGSLAADVLIGSKLRALDKAYDALKLLKRGCKIVRKTTLSAVSSASLVASQASASSARTGGTPGCPEGAIDHKVYDPDTGNIITDIDLFEGGVMWELKTATYGETDWLDKHVNKKLANYLKCRELLSGYESAPIGFRFTKSGMDPRFRAALEARFEQLRRDHPGLDLRLEIAH